MSVNEVQEKISGEIRAAVRAATAKAVHPKDEFGEPVASGTTAHFDVRVAGWDPRETRSNEALLRKATAHLERNGWTVHPEMTDSSDRSALIAKPGLAEGRLYAANQSLTFTGRGELPAD